MAAIDLVIIIVVLVSALLGLARGLLREVMALATWLAALLLAVLLAPALAEQLAGQIGNASVRLGVAFVAVFVGTLIAGGLAQRLLGALVKTTGLSGTDRMLGFLFGGARGLLVCTVALMALRQFLEAGTWWQSSLLVPELLAFEQDVLELLAQARDWIIHLGYQE